MEEHTSRSLVTTMFAMHIVLVLLSLYVFHRLTRMTTGKPSGMGVLAILCLFVYHILAAVHTGRLFYRTGPISPLSAFMSLLFFLAEMLTILGARLLIEDERTRFSTFSVEHAKGLLRTPGELGFQAYGFLFWLGTICWYCAMQFSFKGSSGETPRSSPTNVRAFIVAGYFRLVFYSAFAVDTVYCGIRARARMIKAGYVGKVSVSLTH